MVATSLCLGVWEFTHLGSFSFCIFFFYRLTKLITLVINCIEVQVYTEVRYLLNSSNLSDGEIHSLPHFLE
jgi:amino acid permease